MSKIYSFVYQSEPSKHEEPYRFMRTPIKIARLIANHGIEGDRKAGKNKTRHLNIMTLETLHKHAENGYQTGPGEMGEQIIIEGLDVTSLSKGDRIQIGDSAVIQINSPRSGCSWFELVQGKSKDIDLGVMASVIEGGTISVGDYVKVLQSV